MSLLSFDFPDRPGWLLKAGLWTERFKALPILQGEAGRQFKAYLLALVLLASVNAPVLEDLALDLPASAVTEPLVFAAETWTAASDAVGLGTARRFVREKVRAAYKVRWRDLHGFTYSDSSDHRRLRGESR